MKKIILPILLSVALCGCGDSDQGISVVCGNYDVNIKLGSDGTHLSALINNKPFDFILGTSASGAKYDGIVNGNNVSLWNKGESWTMFVNEDIVFECK